MDAVVQDAVRAAMARESALASNETAPVAQLAAPVLEEQPAEKASSNRKTSERESESASVKRSAKILAVNENGAESRNKSERRRERKSDERTSKRKSEFKSERKIEKRSDRKSDRKTKQKTEVGSEQMSPAPEPVSSPAAEPIAKPVSSVKKPTLGSNWAALRAQMPKPAVGVVKRRPRMPFRSTDDAPVTKPVSQDPLQCSMFVKTALRSGVNVKPTKVVALDCEFVGVGPEGKEDALARASLVNSRGEVLYDSFVRVETRVVDYRFRYSGVKEADITGPGAADPREAQREIAALLKGRILVGHAVKNDLRVLRIPHPQRDTRDTSDYYKKLWKRDGRGGGAPPALRLVVARVLGVDQFQTAEHDSCEDARAALALYKKNSKEWESSRKSVHSSKTRNK